jgi:membrane protease YdiL (CAAX protease family)
VLENPILWTGYLFPFAPTAAALIIVALGWGGKGLRELFDRLRFWREGVTWRQGMMVYTTLFAVYLAIVAFLLIVLMLREPNSGLTQMLQRYGSTPFAIFGFMIIAPFLGPGGLLEELGWRGFMFPLLVQKLANPLLACVVIGVLWGLWHFPREIPSIASGNPALLKGGSWGGFALNQLQFVAGTIVSSVLIAYVYFKTGGSVWAAILTHNIGNEFAVGLTLFTKSQLQIAGLSMDVDTPFKVAIALLIVTTTGTQLGRRREVT